MKIYALNTINVNEPLTSSVSLHKSIDEAVNDMREALALELDEENDGRAFIEERLNEAERSIRDYGEYFEEGDSRLYIVKEIEFDC